MARAEKIYIGAENRIVRELTRSGAVLSAEDKSAITKVQAWIGESVCLDTDEAAHPIEYADGIVTMQPGIVAGLEPGEYTVHFRVFDPDHATGLAWGSFEAEAVQWPACEVAP